MSLIGTDLMTALPELFLLTATCVVLVVDVYLPDSSRVFTYRLAQLSLVVTAVLCIAVFPDSPRVAFTGTFIADRMGALLKVFGSDARGFFAMPSVAVQELARSHGVRIIGSTDDCRERFFAISAERRLKHPAVVEISRTARGDLFADPAS